MAQSVSSLPLDRSDPGSRPVRAVNFFAWTVGKVVKFIREVKLPDGSHLFGGLKVVKGAV